MGLEIRKPLINPDVWQKTLLGGWSPYICAWCGSRISVVSARATNSQGRNFHVSCAEQTQRFAITALLEEES